MSSPQINAANKNQEGILELESNNKKYIFKFKIYENKLLIQSEMNDSLINHFYEKKFSIEEIHKNKYFLQFDTIEEILNELILKMRMTKPTLIIEKNKINLIISLSSSKFKDINLCLDEKIKNNEDKFQEIYEIVSQLKKENIQLKEEVNTLKEEIKILKEFKNRIEQKEKEKEEEIKGLFDSKILGKDKLLNSKIKNWINSNKKIKAELKYRLSRDGSDFDTFHNLCDGISPNLILIQSENNCRFGGFTYQSWEKKDLQKKDNESFLFSLDYNKKYPQKHKDYNAIYCYSSKGPWFYGGDIGFYGNNMTQCESRRNGNYLDGKGLANNQQENFNVIEVEFFHITIE